MKKLMFILGILIASVGTPYCKAMMISDVAVKDVHPLFKKVSREVLQALFLPEVKDDDKVMQLVIGQLATVYETKPRFIESKVEGRQHGFAYPVQPESLAHLMRTCKDKNVLELGGARGENGIFIGLAGARHVWINDINGAEVQEAAPTINRLSVALQAKFSLMPGDCFTVFSDAQFDGLFDVILARNLFHFFAGKNRIKFIALVERLLKPGGRLILDVNSARQSGFKEALEADPEAYVFARRIPMCRQPGRGRCL